MFRIRDRAIKVEHSKTMSIMSSWSLNKGNKWVKENLESIDFAMSLGQEQASFDLCMQQSWKFYIVMKSRRYLKMISRKGMDELFLGYKEFENIHD